MMRNVENWWDMIWCDKIRWKIMDYDNLWLDMTRDDELWWGMKEIYNQMWWDRIQIHEI